MMKRTITLFFILIGTLAIYSQKSLSVKNPLDYPYGVNIDMSLNADVRWSREFNISYNGTGNMLAFGAQAKGGTLEYGYIGGNNKANITNFQNPWMTFLPNGNIGIGTKTPQHKLQIEGDIYSKGWLRIEGQKGVYFQTYGGGFYMVDNDWIRTYNNKNFYHNTGIMRTDGIFQVGQGGNRFIVNAQGAIGIGVKNPQSKLEVNGTIRAKEVKIEATGWADFVFNPEYKLPTLSDVESHILEYGHLPNIPSESEVKENGVNMGEMQVKLLQKIEELTLYIIEQDRKYNELKKELNNLKR